MPRFLALLLALAALPAAAQSVLDPTVVDATAPFRQLDAELPTPGPTRTASGAPGHAYWQQRADYRIRATLDDDRRRITGSETITYHNASPDALPYLWLQLDQNVFARDADATTTRTGGIGTSMPASRAAALLVDDGYRGGYEIARVADGDGRPLPHVVNRTMMRVDLARPLQPGQSTLLSIDWAYDVSEHARSGGRTGYEVLGDGQALYQIAHWFPRMAVYDDVRGWKHKQFLGTGEFALALRRLQGRAHRPGRPRRGGDRELQNPGAVLTEAQRQRLAEARGAERPVLVVTPEEAAAARRGQAAGTKTWIFRAEDVRDFAWASSRNVHLGRRRRRRGRPDRARPCPTTRTRPTRSGASTRPRPWPTRSGRYSRYAFDYPYPRPRPCTGRSSAWSTR